jgi:hypothetical protein
MTAHIPESASAWLIDAANMMPPRDPNDDDDENEQNDDVIFLMAAGLLSRTEGQGAFAQRHVMRSPVRTGLRQPCRRRRGGGRRRG